MAEVTSEWDKLFETELDWGSSVGGSDVVNLPQLLRLTWDEADILFKGCNENGDDFRIIDTGTTTALEYHIKTWDKVNKIIEIWFASPLNINGVLRVYEIYGKNHSAPSLSSITLFADWHSRYAMTELVSKSKNNGSLGDTAANEATWQGNTNSRRGTGATGIRGVSSKALRMDGAGDYLDVPIESNFDYKSCAAVFCRFRVDSFTNSWQALITKGDNEWRLHRNNANDAIAFTCSGLTTTIAINDTAVDDGEWHSALGLYNGVTIAIYIDGDLNGASSELASTGNIAVAADAVKIGRNKDVTNRDWDGDIEDARIVGAVTGTTEVDFLIPEYIEAMHQLIDNYDAYYTNDITLLKLGWTRRMRLLIDWTDVNGNPGSGYIADGMPVEINEEALTAGQLTAYMTTLATKGRNDGGDVRFSMSATSLASEVLGAYIVRHDQVNKEFTYFVNPETEINGNNVYIYMYYRNGEAEQPPPNEQGGAKACMNGDGNTLMVSMLDTRGETTVNLAYDDSLLKTAGETGNVEGTNSLPLQYGDSPTGRSRRYTANNDKVDYGSPNGNDWQGYSSNGDGLMKSGMIWAKVTTDGADMTFMGKRNHTSGNEGFQIKRLATNRVRLMMDYDGGSIYVDTDADFDIAAGWQHYGYQLTDINPAIGADMHCFIDGANADDNATGSRNNMVINNTHKFSIGTSHGDNDHNQMKGSLAYGAMYSVIRSSSWFLATVEFSNNLNQDVVSADGDTEIGYDTDIADIANWDRVFNIYSKGGFTVQEHYSLIDEKQIPTGLLDYFFNKVQPGGGDIVAHFMNPVAPGVIQVPVFVARCDTVNKKLQLRVKFTCRAGGGDNIRIYINPDRALSQPPIDSTFGTELAQNANTKFSSPFADTGTHAIDRSENPSDLLYRSGLPVIVDGQVGQANDLERGSSQNAESPSFTRDNNITSVVAGKLVDSGADFENLDVDIGFQVVNRTLGLFALVIGIEDSNTLLLDTDIMTGAGNSYKLSQSMKLQPIEATIYGTVWARFESDGNDQCIMAQARDGDGSPIGWSFRRNWGTENANEIYAIIRRTNVGDVNDIIVYTENTPVAKELWTKISFMFKATYSAANAKIWINGQPIAITAERDNVVGIVAGRAKMSIGARVDDGSRSRYFDGLMQQNRVLIGTDWTDDMEYLSYTNENDTEDYWGFASSGRINRGLINDGLISGGQRG